MTSVYPRAPIPEMFNTVNPPSNPNPTVDAMFGYEEGSELRFMVLHTVNEDGRIMRRSDFREIRMRCSNLRGVDYIFINMPQVRFRLAEDLSIVETSTTSRVKSLHLTFDLFLTVIQFYLKSRNRCCRLKDVSSHITLNCVFAQGTSWREIQPFRGDPAYPCKYINSSLLRGSANSIL